MTIDRRSFLYAGGMTAAAAPFATVAHAASHGARSVTDFGVEPNATGNLGAWQKAINEISAAGNAIYIPGGRYYAGDISLPPKCVIVGVPGQTVLTCKIGGTAFTAGKNERLHLSGLTFDGNAKKGDVSDLGTYTLDFRGGEISLIDCHVRNASMAALYAEGVTGAITTCTFSDCNYGALLATDTRGLLIDRCRFERCGQNGAPRVPLGTSSISVEGDGVRITANFISECSSGIALRGSGIVSGNVISKAEQTGLKLGSAKSNGHIICQSNLIRDCRIGIGVSSSGDDIMASLNMIAGAKEGAIRAFDGDRLVGPDLARQSAEAYLNLMVAGNVVR
jgi:hypothetical protein